MDDVCGWEAGFLAVMLTSLDRPALSIEEMMLVSWTNNGAVFGNPSRKRVLGFMARPFYPHEADDPDLDWLVSNFLYDRPDYYPVESGLLPLVLIPVVEDEFEEMSIKNCDFIPEVRDEE